MTSYRMLGCSYVNDNSSSMYNNTTLQQYRTRLLSLLGLGLNGCNSTRTRGPHATLGVAADAGMSAHNSRSDVSLLLPRTSMARADDSFMSIDKDQLLVGVKHTQKR